MASFFELVTKLQISIDNLDALLSGSSTTTVQINGKTRSSIEKAINDQFSAIKSMVVGRKSYSTKAALDADLVPSADMLAEVWNDPIPENNGLFGKVGGSGSGYWKKSQYNNIDALQASLEQAQANHAAIVASATAGLSSYKNLATQVAQQGQAINEEAKKSAAEAKTAATMATLDTKTNATLATLTAVAAEETRVYHDQTIEHKTAAASSAAQAGQKTQEAQAILLNVAADKKTISQTLLDTNTIKLAVMQTRQEVATQVNAASVSAAAAKLQASVADTQALLVGLLSARTEMAAAEADKDRSATAYHAQDANRARYLAIQAQTGSAASATAAEKIATDCATLLANIQAQSLELTQQVNLSVQQAKAAADAAIAISTDHETSTTPAPGKLPIAEPLTNQLHPGWLNNEVAFSNILSAFCQQALSEFEASKNLDNLKLQVAASSQLVESLIKRIESGLSVESGSVPVADFQGVHAAGESHKLPVFNMTERDFLAEAAQEEGYAELLRTQGGSGIVSTRQYQADGGFTIGKRVIDVSYATLNIHNHPNYMGQPGMAEIAAVINGYYFRTRHMDYRMMYPIIGKYLERAITPAPALPANISTLPTGCNSDGSIDFNGTQAEYLRDVKISHKRDCIWNLAYLECWVEAATGDNLSDPADSFRHANITSTLTDNFNQGRYLNASGHKNRLENISYQPMTVRFVDAFGVPQFGVLKYRINSYPVADLQNVSSDTTPTFVVGNSESHYHSLDSGLTATQMADLKSGAVAFVDLQTSINFNHSHAVRVTWNGSNFLAIDIHPTHQHPIVVVDGNTGHLPYDEAKAIAGVIDNSNRFKLIKDLRTRQHKSSWSEVARSRMGRFECADLERLCEKVPGLQGDGAVLQESYDQYGLNETLDSYDKSGPLNAAKYNRRYSFQTGDASGRASAHRGFNDPTLFVAKTTHPNVIGGFSWMIPLELILRTPRESWNPYQLPAFDYNALKTEESAGKGKSAATPFSGIHSTHFYYGMPVATVPFNDTQSDPADTAQSAWVLDSSGTARQCYGNGIRVHDVDGMRQRFPVYPLYAEFSHEFNQLHWLKQTVKTLFSKAAGATLTAADIDDLL